MSGNYEYIIIGSGIAGTSAVEGIREIDPDGSILMVGRESYLPYLRPPLSTDLWAEGGACVDIFVHDQEYYDKNNITVRHGVEVTRLNPVKQTITDSAGNICGYEKLLIAPGGQPCRLTIPGGNDEGIIYFRNLDDYNRLREAATEGKRALVIGAGFVGHEIAASLCRNSVKTSMLFPEPYIQQKILPDALGGQMMKTYTHHGIDMYAGDIPVSIEKNGNRYITKTRNGEAIESDILVISVGLEPELKLARNSGLVVNGGILVNEFMQTSISDIYSAGDATFFPCKPLNRMVRYDFPDNSIAQGRVAGRNMAGKSESYDYLPYFSTVFFDYTCFGIGEVTSRHDIFYEWVEDNYAGIIWYHQEGKIRGALICNMPGRIDEAREIISKGGIIKPERLGRVIGPNPEERDLKIGCRL